MKEWATWTRQRGTAAKIGLLAGSLLILYAATAPLAFWLAGVSGLLAAGASGLMCLLPAMAALLIGTSLKGENNYLSRMLLAMMFRTGVPLVLALLLLRKGPLVDAGAVYYLVVFYLVALGTETLLSLPAAEPSVAAAKTHRHTVS